MASQRSIVSLVISNPMNRVSSGIANVTGRSHNFPPGVHPFRLLQKIPSGRNSYLLRFQLPSLAVAETDEAEARLTTLGSRGVKLFVHGEIKDTPGSETVLEKSYSPVSLPSTEGYFDLLVKGYVYRPGGGLGEFLCEGLNVGDAAFFKVKKERSIFGVTQLPELGKKFKRIGLVAGGTGLAPLVQIARVALLDEEQKGGAGSEPHVSLLVVNREEQDILMRTELDDLAEEHPDRFRLTYALTDAATLNDKSLFHLGRGDAALAQRALPEPSDETLVLVCGTDGFVGYWAGPIVKELNETTGKKVKVQGPLLGVLKDAGFAEHMVYKY